MKDDQPTARASAEPRERRLLRLFVRRICLIVPSILIASILLFLILRGLPGDASFTLLSGSTHTEAMREALRGELGLDRPWYEQYARWMTGLFSGASSSLTTGEPVRAILSRTLPVTLLLSVYSIALSFVVALPLGVIAGVFERRWPDRLIRTATLAGVSTPAIWSSLLILLFLVRLFRWSPPIFYASPFEDPLEHASLMIWPVLLLSWQYGSYIVRVTRASIIDVLKMDYVATAYAKGQKRWIVIVRYGFRNALVPPVTSAGLVFGSLFGGAVVVESVFGIPGVGRGIAEAALARDIPVVLSFASVLVLLYALLNIVVDMAVLILDPRIDTKGGARP